MTLPNGVSAAFLFFLNEINHLEIAAAQYESSAPSSSLIKIRELLPQIPMQLGHERLCPVLLVMGNAQRLKAVFFADKLYSALL